MIPIGLTHHMVAICAALTDHVAAVIFLVHHNLVAAVIFLVHHNLVAAVIRGISVHPLAVVVAALLLHQMELLVLNHPAPARSVRGATDSSSLIMDCVMIGVVNSENSP